VNEYKTPKRSEHLIAKENSLTVVPKDGVDFSFTQYPLCYLCKYSAFYTLIALKQDLGKETYRSHGLSKKPHS